MYKRICHAIIITSISCWVIVVPMNSHAWAVVWKIKIKLRRLKYTNTQSDTISRTKLLSEKFMDDCLRSNFHVTYPTNPRWLYEEPDVILYSNIPSRPFIRVLCLSLFFGVYLVRDAQWRIQSLHLPILHLAILSSLSSDCLKDLCWLEKLPVALTWRHDLRFRHDYTTPSLMKFNFLFLLFIIFFY